jgi:hypothetical protein
MSQSLSVSPEWFGTGLRRGLSGQSCRENNSNHQAPARWQIVRGPPYASVAPDGSFAIITYFQTPVTVNIYKANGEPIRTVIMPPSLGFTPDIAYSAKHLVAAGEGRLVIFDSSGSPLQSFKPAPASEAAEDAAWWSPYLVNDGRQLLLFDGESTTLHRYAMP